MLRTGEFAGTYQNSLDPVEALPTTVSGAPLANAAITDVVPSPIPMPTLPAITETLAEGRYDAVHLVSPGPAGVGAATRAGVAGMQLVQSL